MLHESFLPESPTEANSMRTAFAKRRCSFSNDSYTHSDGGGSYYSQQRAENADVHIRRVKSMLPEHGKVGVMRVTDKQFGDMLLFDCKKEAQLHKPVQQLELF